MTQYPFNFPSKVTQYDVPPTRALELSQATCERTGFYARIRRWRARQSVVVESTTATTTPLSDLSSLTAPSVFTASASSNTDSSTARRSDRRSQYLKGNMPSFNDFEKSNEAMSKRKKRSSTQAAQDFFIEKADNCAHLITASQRRRS